MKKIFGTPLEDAQRRDLTINSMFYNLNQDKIEDFIKSGLDDLRNGIIRTPINPIETFTDDSLRILRSFRFATKYDFKVSPEIIECIKMKEIKESLASKVSRQRIRTEVEKILIDKNVETGLDLIFQNDLWSTAFLISDIENKCQELKECDFYTKKQQQSYQLAKLAVKDLQKMIETQEITQQCTAKDLQLIFIMSAICFPLADLVYKKNKKSIPLPYYLSFESLVFPEKLSNTIQIICDSALQFQKLVQQNYEQQFNQIAKLIKNQGQTWEISLMIAQLYDQLTLNYDLKNRYEEIKKFIYTNQLQRAYDIVLFIQGKEIMDLFDLNKQGPIIGTIKERIFLWQAKNYEKGKDDLVADIVANKQKFMD